MLLSVAYATIDDILMSENCYDVGGMRLRCMNGHEHMVYTFLFVCPLGTVSWR